MSIPSPRPTEWVFDAHRNPSVYTRPLVGSELIMQRLWKTDDASGEVCIGINFTSTLEAEELKDRVRVSLDKLRFVCPIIACAIEGTAPPRWVYTPSADREAWLNLALVVEERGISLNPSHFVQSIGLKRLPYADDNGMTTLFRVYLLTTSEHSDNESKDYGLYFHGIHSIIDAGPALHALNLMCEWISGGGLDVKVEPCEEWKNLPVDPVIATGGQSKEWEASGMKLLQEIMGQDARSSPCHTLPPPSQPSNISDPPFHYTITMSESETAAIVAETKKLGISVSTLFLAVHCLAQCKMNPVEGAVTEVDFSTDMTIVSLERYMKPPIDPRTHLISSFILMPLRFSMAQPLRECAERARLIMTTKLVQERFDRYLGDPCFPHLLSVIASMLPADMEPDNTTEQPEQAQASWSCAFNNIGMVEHKLRTQHENITVGSLCVGVRQKHTMNVHAWTMHSKLHLHVQGTTVWGEERMKTLVEEMRQIALLIIDDS